MFLEHEVWDSVVVKLAREAGAGPLSDLSSRSPHGEGLRASSGR